MCTDRRGRAGSNAESGGRWLGIAGLDAADTRYSGLATFLASRRADAATGIFGTDDWSVEHGCRAHRSDYRRGRGLWSVVGDFGRLSPVPGARRAGRSEEHTSELQSLMRISYAVFCLKKKTN